MPFYAIHRPHPLFDAIKQEFNLPTDGALADFLRTHRPSISKIRGGAMGVSGDMILTIYDRTGWSIERIRAEMNPPQEAA